MNERESQLADAFYFAGGNGEGTDVAVTCGGDNIGEKEVRMVVQEGMIEEIGHWTQNNVDEVEFTEVD